MNNRNKFFKELIMEKFQGIKLDSTELCICELIQLKRKGWLGINSHLKDKNDHIMKPSVFSGIISSGNYYIAPFADITLNMNFVCLHCNEAIKLSDKLLIKLLKIWSSIIPANGHISIEYENEDQIYTMKLLNKGFPAILTPLGFCSYFAGFTGGFKDWYFAEGGMEGPRKLQINKSLNSRYALIMNYKITKELIEFLDQFKFNSQGIHYLDCIYRAEFFLKYSKNFLIMRRNKYLFE